jgi:hypothetical protein
MDVLERHTKRRLFIWAKPKPPFWTGTFETQHPDIRRIFGLATQYPAK